MAATGHVAADRTPGLELPPHHCILVKTDSQKDPQNVPNNRIAKKTSRV